MNSSKALIIAGKAVTVPAELEPVGSFLAEIRPEWQAKRLVQRVISLLPVDASSACQRLLNAAIKDLQAKIVIAGIDLATEAAKLHKLPPVTKPDDVLENYSTTNTLELAYRMGLLSRPEWRRLMRAYDIRKDLEHEDNEYEAQYEDCIYVFSACIDIVLSRDPIELIRIADVKEIIESPNKVTFTPDLLEDYGRAPEVRQTEIVRMLVGVARSSKQADIVRQNAVEALRNLQPLTMDKVKITIAAESHDRLKGQLLQPVDMKIAAAIGAVPYLKQRRVSAFFSDIADKLDKVSPAWESYSGHSDPLSTIEDYGGLAVIPEDQLERIAHWMTRCYLGEKGGYGAWGRNRAVFYSDVAAPIIERLFKAAGKRVRAALEKVATDQHIVTLISYKPIARRLEKLRDLTDDTALT
jgi:hypothetical protein